MSGSHDGAGTRNGNVVTEEGAKGAGGESDVKMVYSTVGGIVLALLLVVLMVLVAVRRLRREPPDAREKKSSRLGDLPHILKVHADSTLFKAPIAYSNFCRCISFDTLRHERPHLDLDDKTVLVIFDLLQLERPPAWDIGPLRILCRQFLRKVVGRHPDQYIKRSVDFVYSALADVLVEECLDAYVAAECAIEAHQDRKSVV